MGSYHLRMYDYATMEMISDGVRLTWTKSGSKTGTESLLILAFR
jgi:hypothetical protein